MANILLVDDDQFIRDINSDVLTGEGHTVVTAIDGEDAYTKLKSRTFDLVLVDVILPKMTGIEVISKIRQELQQAFSTKIVFLTNSDDEKDKAAASGLGGQYVMKSTLTPPDLIVLVQEQLQSQA